MPPDSFSPFPEEPDASSEESRTPEDSPAGKRADHSSVAEDASENPDPAGHVRRNLLAALGGLYTLAQALTTSERAARHLVEATYERAAADLIGRQFEERSAPEEDRFDGAPRSERSPFRSAEALRPYLYRLLVETARRDEHPGESSEGAPDGTNEGGGRDRHFHRRIQNVLLERTLPAAFASLAPAQRLLLALLDIERVPVAEAAEITSLSEADARDQHARARADLREALRQMAPRPERPFLEDDALPDARLATALRGVSDHALAAPPPALRAASRHALDHGHRMGRRSASRPAESGGESPEESTPDAAADRLPVSSEENESKTLSQPARRRLLAFLLIALVGGLGYLATALLEAPGETDLAALAVRQSSEVNVRLRTDRPGSAEQFVRDELGRRLRVPRIEGASLQGVGLSEVVPGEHIPVFLFRDAASERPVAMYAYDYALLDRAGSRLELTPDVRQQLEEEGRVATRDVEGRRVLLWRHRDDIFAAVTGRTDSLQERIML